MPEYRVLITGGSRGIGKAIAKCYSKAGHCVLTPPRNELDLNSIESILNYGKAGNYEVDVLINNAGKNIINSISDISINNWQQTLTVNLTAPFLLVQKISPYMVQNKWGRIVNISSIYSIISRKGRAAYSASKAGLNGFTRTAALEYAEEGILVNSVCPGFVDTDLTRQNNTQEQLAELTNHVPLRKLGSPDEIANFVYFLGSEQNQFITGQTIPIDGGFTTG